MTPIHVLSFPGPSCVTSSRKPSLLPLPSQAEHALSPGPQSSLCFTAFIHSFLCSFIQKTTLPGTPWALHETHITSMAFSLYVCVSFLHPGILQGQGPWHTGGGAGRQPTAESWGRDTCWAGALPLRTEGMTAEAQASPSCSHRVPQNTAHEATGAASAPLNKTRSLKTSLETHLPQATKTA